MLSDLFIYCTLIGGGALVLQVVMMFFGFDDLFEGAEGVDGGFDLDVDADVADGGSSGFWILEMLSLRTCTAALTFFGLGGWIATASGQPQVVALVAAVASGYAAMYSVYWSLKQMLKLEKSGNLDIRNTVGRSGKVYIPIPADRAGAGKVQMTVQDRLVEFQAVTEEAEPLKTGDRVTVVDLVANDTLLVEPVVEHAEA